MCRKVSKSSLAFLLVCAMIFSMCPVVFAADIDKDRVELGDPTVMFGDGYLEEQQTVVCGGSVIEIVRVTHENGDSMLSITENGVTTVSICQIDYEVLFCSLSEDYVPQIAPYCNSPAYDYDYVTTYTQTSVLRPENYTYAKILEAVSKALAGYSVKAAVAARIAALIFENSAANRPTRLVTTRDWYTVTAYGEFLSYHCNYTIVTEIYSEIRDVWVYLDTETGSFDSFYVY